MSNDNDTLGFGLNLFGTKDRERQYYKKRQTPSKTQMPKLPKGGPGSMMVDEAMPVRFPANFYPPEHAESLDIRRLINVAPATVEQEIIRFQAQTAQSVVFYKYGIFTDALDASLVEFIPRLNGKRVLRYHGDPQDNFKLNLSVGPNLNDSNMVACQIYMKPNDVFTWTVTNNDVVINPMGVRMSGYVDVSLKRKTTAFGG